MAFKLRGATAATNTKVYLQPTSDAAAPGSRHYEYVTADAAATVDGSGYIDNSTADGQIALDMLLIGDIIWVFQVASIDDTRVISEDKAVGLTDLSVHIVMENDGTAINLSDELFGGSTITYGD